MNVVNAERITLKRVRPNPLFQDWLEELHEEAEQNASKLEPMLKEALSSISKYPLPLQSGAECAILKGFDKRLCQFLDERLEVYRGSSTEITTTSTTESSNVEITTEGLISCSKTSEQEIGTVAVKEESTAHLNDENSANPQVKRKKLRMQFRSPSYAILMVLIDLDRDQSMSKKQLIEAAQHYCEDDLAQEWKYMHRLVSRGFIKRSTEETPTYTLTEEGYNLANKLFDKSVLSRLHVSQIIMNTPLNDDVQVQAELNKSNLEITHRNETNYESKNIDTVSDSVYDNIIPKSCTEIITHINYNDPGMIKNVRSDQVKDELLIDDSDLIKMESGFYDIILLIDKNETSGLTKKNDPTITEFKNYPELMHEYRSLKVGDFAWIARHRVHTDQELVLPYVVERKRMDDLGASIKDGRFHEQKFRLRKCGLNNVIYLVENHGNNKHLGLPMQSLMQALANTQVQDGFKVHRTDSLSHSVKFLATMTLRLMYEYKDRRLKGHNGEPKADILTTFGYYNKSSVKNKSLSVTDTFIKLLLQLKGVSVEKALIITNHYKTPRLLIEAYENCDQRQGEMLLAKLRFGKFNRSIGPTLSKSIYQLFTFRSMN